MDFTINKYKELLFTLKKTGFTFQTFEQFIRNSNKGKNIVLRHDVDRLPENALQMAFEEANMGIKASYFFRVVPNVWDERVVNKIVELGHEVAYHYEDLSLKKGDYDKAIQHFKKQLVFIRKFYPSKTICMHGSPMSKWDNRKLWEKYDYRDYGIIAEPYFDVDYSKVFYITDTGRGWNNINVNIRDTVKSCFDIKIKSTQHMIELFESGKMPQKVIINTHPHRWFDGGLMWLKELVLQSFKNIVKRNILKYLYGK